MDLKPGDEIVRIDQQPGEMSFSVRRADKSLTCVRLSRPVWTHIQEIGFIVHDVEVSEPDQGVIEKIRARHPDALLPTGLRQLRLMDHEGTKISVIFAHVAATES